VYSTESNCVGHRRGCAPPVAAPIHPQRAKANETFSKTAIDFILSHPTSALSFGTSSDVNAKALFGHASHGHGIVLFSMLLQPPMQAK